MGKVEQFYEPGFLNHGDPVPRDLKHMRLYELFIGFRYLKSKKSQRFISFNTVLSVVMVFLGVFTLIIVISVMNGFQSQIKDKILDVDSHVTVSSYQTKTSATGIKNYRELSRKLSAVPGVVSAEPYLMGQGILKSRNDITPVFVRGIGSPEGIPSDVKKFITEGKKEFGNEPEVFIGAEMAMNNLIDIGSYVEIIVPRGGFEIKEGMTPGMGRFRVKGYFKTGYYEYDTRMIIMSLPQSQRLFDSGDIAWGVGVKIKDVYKMDDIARKFTRLLGFTYDIKTAEERNANLFYALRLEKLVMTIILFLVIVSAGFTIMGTMVMVVMEKRKAVGVLKSMGAKAESIMSIFVLEGFLIGVVGTVCGVVLGLATAINLKSIIGGIETVVNAMGKAYVFVVNHVAGGSIVWFDVSIIPSNVYYVEGIPTQISPDFVVMVSVIAVFLATVSAIFPAWSASRLKPVETIRYE
jgi:lipoprotein-releasing system permease protein